MVLLNYAGSVYERVGSMFRFSIEVGSCYGLRCWLVVVEMKCLGLLFCYDFHFGCVMLNKCCSFDVRTTGFLLHAMWCWICYGLLLMMVSFTIAWLIIVAWLAYSVLVFCRVWKLVVKEFRKSSVLKVLYCYVGSFCRAFRESYWRISVKKSENSGSELKTVTVLFRWSEGWKGCWFC